MSPIIPECNYSASASPPPLQLSADFRLNTDTGATAHMMPHRHWLRDYTPHVVPIKLANGGLVYSEGIGSLQFKPQVEGVWLGPVQFSRVLHVPALRSNLLSILYLTKNHGWECIINATTLAFKRAPTELAHLSITAAPLSQELWHRRCVHHSHATVKKMSSMVTGLVITCLAATDLICEPCLAGKMNANPLLSSQNHTVLPLHRVHSDYMR
jgi:hypothetical protein